MANGPRCSLQTAISIRGDLRGESAWASTALSAGEGSKQLRPTPSPGLHESQVTYERHRNRCQARKSRHCCFRWCLGCCCCRSALYRFPRLSYLLLYLLCSFIGGSVCSLMLTRWGLNMFDVPARLAVARSSLEPMDKVVESTRCAYAKYPHVSNLPALEDQIDAATASAQDLIDTNDAAIAASVAASSQCFNGLAAGLEAFATAMSSTPAGAETRSKIDALSCVGDAVLVLMPNPTAATTNESTLETNRTAIGVANSTRFGLPTFLEQELRSRVVSAHRDASLRLHEHRLRQLAAITNISTAQSITELRVSVADKLGDLVSLVNDSGSSPFDANATARRLVDADDVHQVIAGIGDVVHVMSGFDASMHDVEAQLASMENLSLDAVADITRGERKFDYLSGFMKFQLRRTQLALEEEFRAAQDKTLEISTAAEAQIQEEITAIVTESRKMTRRYERGIIDKVAGESGEESTILSESRASHLLHRLTKSPTATLTSTSTPPPPTPSSPSASSSPWWWWQWWWPHPTWKPQNRKSGEQNVTSSDDNATPKENGASIMSFLKGGAASDLQPTFEWYLIKLESTRLAFVVLELTAGMFTDSFLAAPQVDARQISAIHDIASVWDVVFCRFTVASLVLALAAHGRELIRAARRIGFVGFASLMATLFLMAMKSEHLEVCPQFRRGLHLNTMAAVNTTASPVERTWFMTEMLPILHQVVHESYSTIQLAEELDSHATAMFRALQTLVDAVWSEQIELHARTGQLAESAGAFVTALDSCEVLDPTFALSFVNDSVVQQCQLAKNLSASPMPAPGAPNVSVAGLIFATPGQTQAPTFGDDFTLGISGNSTGCPLLSQQGMESRDESLAKLNLRYLCAAEEAAYLSLTSWLLFLFVLGVNNLVGKLALEASSMCWWRFLNNNRISFIGYCTEDGRVESSDALPQAIKELSRDVWWQVAIRFVAASTSVAGVVVVWFVLLS